MKKVLVTGGAGFIGSHLVRALLQEEDFSEYQIVVLDDLSGGRLDNVPQDSRVTFIEGTITDAARMMELFETHSFTHVYHLAAYAAEGLSHFIRHFNYTNNLIGSINLLNCAVNTGCECFVFTSSIAVYGTGQVPMREDMSPVPEDPYGIAKLAFEMDLRAAHEMFGLNYVVFRPHNVYGEYQNIGDKYRNVIGIFMNQLLKGDPMTIFGDGSQQRAFSYVGDIAPIIARSPLVAAARNRIFNVGADTPYTVSALSEAVARAICLPCETRHLDARNEVLTAYSDHSAARQVFGEPLCTSLTDGLALMAAWVREAGVRHSQDFDAIEILQGLPDSWRS